MRVLVTGLNGFTGHYAGRALADAGHDVVGLSADLRDAEAVASDIASTKPDAVMHLAAQAFVAHEDTNEIYVTNLIGTNNLLTAIRQHAPEVSSIVLASSASVYGNASEGRLAETQAPNPANHYAVSKLAMEMAARLHVHDLPITIVRPFNYTGVGQDEKFLVPKIVDHFRRREQVIELGNLDVYREFGDVRRVAAIYAELVATPQPGLTVNICTGAPHSLRDVVEACSAITGHEIELTVNPAFVRANDVRTLAGDPSLLESAVRVPEPIALEETLKWMLDASSSDA